MLNTILEFESAKWVSLEHTSSLNWPEEIAIEPNPSALRVGPAYFFPPPSKSLELYSVGLSPYSFPELIPISVSASAL